MSGPAWPTLAAPLRWWWIIELRVRATGERIRAQVYAPTAVDAIARAMRDTWRLFPHAVWAVDDLVVDDVVQEGI